MRGSWWRAMVLVVGLPTVLLPAVPAAAADDELTVVFVAVRQGSGAIYQGPCGEVAVVDVPLHRHEDVAEALDEHVGTRTISWANVSHYHADHVGGLAPLAALSGVSVGTVYDRGGDAAAYDSATYEDYHDWVTGPSVTRHAVDIGDVLTLCSGSEQVRFEVLSVGRDGAAVDGVAVSNEDDHSVCLAITFRSFRGATCGDLAGVDEGGRTDVESVVAPDFGPVHVATVNHHGSANSSNGTYTTTLSPEVAVVSVGANGFGHPTDAALDNWRATGADVYQTHAGGPGDGGNDLVHGDVRVVTDGTSGFTVVPGRGSARAYTLDGTGIASGPGDGARGVGRLSGADRIATGVALAQHGWPDGADTVLVATAEDFPDALAAGALAAKLDAPILLTPRDRASDTLLAELARLAPDDVLILGGTGAVSATVASQLRDEGYAVERIAGAHRWETAGRIAVLAGAPSDGYAVASGIDFPDALSAGSLSATPQRLPTVLATRDALPVDTPALLGLGDEAAVRLIGGTLALSESLAASLRGDVERLSGPSRFQTSSEVTAAALQLFDTTPRPLLVATGGNFPDALAAGALAARVGAPILLVPGDDLSDELATFLRSNRSRFSEAQVIGGGAAVSAQVRSQVERVLNGLTKNPPAPSPPDPGPDPDPDPEPESDPEPGCVDLNSAGFEELQEIIHIGPDRAQQIIDGRPWASVDSLIDVDGIGPARLEDIEDQGLACVT